MQGHHLACIDVPERYINGTDARRHIRRVISRKPQVSDTENIPFLNILVSANA